MKQQILKITENIRVAENVYKMVLEDPELEEMKPGQFVNIRLDGLYLRRPISVCESEAGSLTIIYKVVGKGTEQMSRMKEREKLEKEKEKLDARNEKWEPVYANEQFVLYKALEEAPAGGG